MENAVTISFNEIAECLLFSYRFHDDQEYKHWRQAIHSLVGNKVMVEASKLMETKARKGGFTRKK